MCTYIAKIILDKSQKVWQNIDKKRTIVKKSD
jgi:hypothetical protein